ncbi:CHAT domain-containing tetratricopeptide repeat protein [Sphingopyxis sp.]|uniref:CHAT domain-containing tetratricopeptide repeat protein n=1 Tax=Sphingopyxis sp. TaxID=1908224 RepID=UPI0026099FBB|nr:CHAT domain-containing tetratricopeptide repeat protein [Sphingopyxis sp.]MCW0200068.1 CHAT domain-containing protein [Sphingopyxis sp.]
MTGGSRLWLAAVLVLGASPSVAQFVPRSALIPVESAAQRIAPDHGVPTPAQLEQIQALEREARVDQPCNTTSEKALETPRRALLRLYEDSYGPAHPATARPLLSLLCHFAYNSKTPADRAEREQVMARLVAIGRDRAQPATLYVGLTARSQVRIEQQHPMEAVTDATEALALARRLFIGDPAIVASSARSLAVAFEAAGRPTDAEPLLQEQVTLLQSMPASDRFALAAAYEQLANNFVKQMRMADARIWFSRELDMFEAILPETDPRHLIDIILYSQNLFWTDPDRVEALYRAVLARQEAQPDSDDRRNWMTLWNLAKSARIRRDLDSAIGYQRRVIGAMGPGVGHGFELELAAMLSDRQETAAEAEGLYRGALQRDPDNPGLIESYGNTLWMLGRFDEALPMRRRAVEIAVARYGPNHRETLRLVQNLGVALWIARRPGEARPYYEEVVAGYRAELSALPETANAEYRRNLSGFISSKASDLLKLYWTDRASAAAGGDAASRARGFAMAQLAHPSVSSAAISETAARALAVRAGKGDLFARWAAARDRVVALDQAIAEAAQRGASGDGDRVRLLGERAAAGQPLAEAAAALQHELPDIFATLRPEPVPLAEVTGEGGRAALLRKDEALVLLYPGMPDARGEMSRGVVFVATLEGAAWAEIPIDGADLAQMVGDLGRQLGDPKYSGVTLREPGEDPDAFLRYDRAGAHRLYRALFGDPSVAALLKDRDRWIIVPEGPLLTLNFAALVSEPPGGGAAGDIDPAALRATKWLGLERVISVVPSVDALRIARRSPQSAWAAGGFYGVGDPAFRGIADGPPKPMPPRLRGAPASPPAPAGVARIPRQSLYRDGVADPRMLAKLPRLDYSAAEVREMARLLNAPPDRQLLQLDATQARLARGSAEGVLGNSSIVLFATHALLGGRFDGSPAEPALALTPGTAPAGGTLDATNDGLLTASEVTGLRFNAPLIILSACDTAAGSEGGDGFSGLTRAFLLAGARAILATYSPVVDEVGERMTTTAVARLKDKRDIAAALQEAMREVAADPSHDAQGESFAHPAAWAVYVAIDPS